MKSEFILFHMNGCGYCTMFQPIWNKMSEKYKNEYTFKEIESEQLENSPEANEIHSELGITINGFPSIFCKVENIYYKYEGNRTEEDLIGFIKSIENKKSEHNNDKKSEHNNDEKEHVKFFYFYMNKCKWCEEFSDVWNNIEKQFDTYKCERNEIIKSDEAKYIKKELDLEINSFPSIFIKINDSYYKYNGVRTLESILEFVATVLKKNKFIQDGGKINYRNKYKKYKQMYFEILEKYNKLNK